ncbi:hypothetical protein K505DRAFT_247366 [Melanomma pulvis-pyrius CBS 109.77]|uniref:Uncharacterized protein n=1 Tax=Melanomma pulvis-pyrius CBS 109.77 TaxID=1314802 RepID=A0A6A6X7K4_9PLEO|nr:hypothetical protein K505DRAFT_247366 [Melanomma pulvis-pyrius CBS 109.77]
MSPLPRPLEGFPLRASLNAPFGALLERRKAFEKPTDPQSLVLEAWAQGYMVGSLVILAFITLANMRRGVLLHKLILLELILGLWQGFWLFFNSPVYSWWLSVSAIFLNASWSLHNVIAWMKIRPFLSRPVSLFFIGTVVLVQPYWILEIYANFAYFHNINELFLKTRPWEALCRDPWWIFTTIALFWTIKTQYEITLKEITRISPRFGIMLGAMVLSIVFIILDICSVTGAFHTGTVGINPFWKLAFVFKCLTDAVVLDDFKMALDRLRAFKISRLGSFSQDTSDRRTRNDRNLINVWEEVERETHKAPENLPSPNGDYFTQSSSIPVLKQPRKQKDSVVSPDRIHNDSSSDSFGPEDMVPSALVNVPPMRTMETAYASERRVAEKKHVEWIDDINEIQKGHLGAESDYYQALREVEGCSPSTSPTKTTFPRRSLPP